MQQSINNSFNFKILKNEQILIINDVKNLDDVIYLPTLLNFKDNEGVCITLGDIILARFGETFIYLYVDFIEDQFVLKSFTDLEMCDNLYEAFDWYNQTDLFRIVGNKFTDKELINNIMQKAKH